MQPQPRINPFHSRWQHATGNNDAGSKSNGSGDGNASGSGRGSGGRGVYLQWKHLSLAVPLKGAALRGHQQKLRQQQEQEQQQEQQQQQQHQQAAGGSFDRNGRDGDASVAVAMTTNVLHTARNKAGAGATLNGSCAVSSDAGGGANLNVRGADASASPRPASPRGAHAGALPAAQGAGNNWKTLLHDVSGQVGPGCMLAIMGASGAGKSTLLNVLAGRVRGASGTITLNGVPVNPGAHAGFQRMCGYVTQDAPFFDSLTVRETLMYAARLRLPESVPRVEKERLVDTIISELGLGSCANTFVGKAAEPGGISGGERRRLTLGMELTFNPYLLMCDEVTSGLDAASAARIVRTLKRLAVRQGRTVIATIHQPRASILAMFDQLLLLSGGRVVYYGPAITAAEAAGRAVAVPRPIGVPGSATSMLEYFRAAGFHFRPSHNPADEMLDLVNAEDGSTSESDDSGSDSDTNDGDEPRLSANGGRTGKDARTGASLQHSSSNGSSGGDRRNGHGAASATGGEQPTAPTQLTLREAPQAPVAPNRRHQRRDAVLEHLISYYAASELAAMALEDPPTFPPPAVPSFTGTFVGTSGGGTPPPAGSKPASHERGSTTAITVPPPQARSETVRKYPTSWWTQFWVIAQRSFWYKLRNPDAVMSQAVSAVAMSLVCGSIYYQMGLSQAAARDRLGAISFIILTQSFMAFDLVVLFPAERAVYLRDTASGMYSSFAFYAGRSAAEWPLHMVFAVIAATITYFMYGLQLDAGRWATYVCILALVTNAGASMLLAVGALSSSMAMGNAIATVVLSFASLFNGLFVRDVPVWYRWLNDISFPGLGVKAAMANELRGLVFTCTPEEAAAGCAPDGEALLGALGMGDTDVWANAGWLLLESVVFRLVAFAALHFLYTGQPARERARLLLPGN